MTTHVETQFVVDGDTVPDRDDIALWVSRAVIAAGRNGESEVSVRVVDIDEMQQMNNEFRNRDKPTNVLSFPAGEIAGLPGDAVAPLGDIIVCAEVVASEADEQGKPVQDHWAHMMVHGTLHLLGFDHVSDEDAEVMEALEISVLTNNGIANPYGESLQET